MLQDAGERWLEQSCKTPAKRLAACRMRCRAIKQPQRARTTARRRSDGACSAGARPLPLGMRKTLQSGAPSPAQCTDEAG